MSKPLGIRYGAMSPPISSQVSQQDKKLDAVVAIRFQKIADAVTLLHLQGYLPDVTAGKIRKKLTNKIAETVK